MKKVSPSKTKTYQRVKRDIEAWVLINSNILYDFSRWYCGITNDPTVRERRHKHKLQLKPYFFISFDAKSKRIARALETSFHIRGMKDTDKHGGAKESSRYIYVYKIRPTILDDPSIYD